MASIPSNDESHPDSSKPSGKDNSTDSNEHNYDMKHNDRGHAVIINNRTFRRSLRRRGTDKDANSMKKLLNHLGFKNDHIKQTNNVSSDQMKQLMIEASKKDYTDSDCFVCVILSHGDEGLVYGSDDESIKISQLIAPLKKVNCPSLAGKPKIFFIQACQGKDFDLGNTIKTEADGNSPEEGNNQFIWPVKEELQIPTEPDFLISYSSVPGYYSWRDEDKGSWFIQSVEEVIRSKHESEDLLSMMTEVNRKVAFDFEFNTLKQMPCTSTMLTRRIFF